ncbi:hypothetical protein PPERSA_12378 [Pseudocohnilembus persalinus]|uniref:RRM domain-containing protein n=1 Tax=Pseudocohnilembus persalinus TaxID=266149 RepID=A0A0V0QG34_PSEPJ|nr:hypothetical protein PPERSA_12378 [Pseudocohnilembus persalinus]|eukprot:KRX01098.1 hypothetical protein PPERSA_12378 [Pseudocohnilembus persalinus]
MLRSTVKLVNQVQNKYYFSKAVVQKPNDHIILENSHVKQYSQFTQAKFEENYFINDKMNQIIIVNKNYNSKNNTNKLKFCAKTTDDLKIAKIFETQNKFQITPLKKLYQPKNEQKNGQNISLTQKQIQFFAKKKLLLSENDDIFNITSKNKKQTTKKLSKKKTTTTTTPQKPEISHKISENLEKNQQLQQQNQQQQQQKSKIKQEMQKKEISQKTKEKQQYINENSQFIIDENQKSLQSVSNLENFEELEDLQDQYDNLENEGFSEIMEGGVSQKELESGGESEYSEDIETNEEKNQKLQKIKKNKTTQQTKNSNLGQKKTLFKLYDDPVVNQTNLMKFVNKSQQLLTQNGIEKLVRLVDHYKSRVSNNNFANHSSTYEQYLLKSVNRIFLKENAQELEASFIRCPINELTADAYKNISVNQLDNEFEIKQKQALIIDQQYDSIPQQDTRLNEIDKKILQQKQINQDKKQSQYQQTQQQQNSNFNQTQMKQKNNQQSQTNNIKFNFQPENISEQQKLIIQQLYGSQNPAVNYADFNNNNIQEDNFLSDAFNQQYDFALIQQKYDQFQNQKAQQQKNNSNSINNNNKLEEFDDGQLLQQELDQYQAEYQQNSQNYNQELYPNHYNPEWNRIPEDSKFHKIIQDNDNLDQQVLQKANNYLKNNNVNNLNNDNNYNNNNLNFNQQNQEPINNLETPTLSSNQVQNDNDFQDNDYLKDDVQYTFCGAEEDLINQHEQYYSTKKNAELLEGEDNGNQPEEFNYLDQNDDLDHDAIDHDEETVQTNKMKKLINNDVNSNSGSEYVSLQSLVIQNQKSNYKIDMGDIYDKHGSKKIKKIHDKKVMYKKTQYQPKDENIILYQRNFNYRIHKNSNFVYACGFQYTPEADLADQIKKTLSKQYGEVLSVQVFAYRDFMPAFGDSIEKREKKLAQLELQDLEETLSSGKKTKSKKKAVFSKIVEVKESEQTREERQTQNIMKKIEEQKAKYHNRSYAIIELKNHEAKKELLSDDVRVFGIRIGNNNNVKFEDAEYKISILVRNIPYQISIADFKQFFNALCDENDCESLRLEYSEGDKSNKITKEYIILRFKSLQDSLQAMKLIHGQKFEKQILRSNHYYGSLIPEDPYKKHEETYEFDDDNENILQYRENFESHNKKFLLKKVKAQNDNIYKQISDDYLSKQQYSFLKQNDSRGLTRYDDNNNQNKQISNNTDTLFSSVYQQHNNNQQNNNNMYHFTLGDFYASNHFNNNFNLNNSENQHNLQQDFKDHQNLQQNNNLNLNDNNNEDFNDEDQDDLNEQDEIYNLEQEYKQASQEENRLYN